MPLSDGTSINDWVTKSKKTSRSDVSRPDVSILAAFADLRAVLDALPNSRAELEGIVEQARGVLDELDRKLASTQAALALRINERLGEAESRVQSEARESLARMQEFERAVAALRVELTESLSAMESWRSEVSPDPAALEALADRASVQETAERLEALIEMAKAEFRESVDATKTLVEHRLRGAMMGSPAPSAITVKVDGRKVADRKAINFISGDGATVEAADNGSKKQIDVTVGATGGSVAIVAETAPESPATDQLWYDSTLELLKRWDGAEWVTEGSGTYEPVGGSFASHVKFGG